MRWSHVVWFGALTSVLSLTLSAADWPTYLGNNARTATGTDTTLSTANASQLTKAWQYTTGGTVESSAAVVAGVLYVGSWDGYEYALDATTGTLKWKTYLGQTTTPNCTPSTLGVSSAATVLNGTVYVGGGDAYWYALSASTGAVLWKVYTGDNSPNGGHYNWSSPLIYNGAAYIGIASNCDNPLVQGQLLRVDLTTHNVTNTLDVVPSGHSGGTIWTSPAVDAATNTIYVTTGTPGGAPQYAVAMLAIDASSLSIKSGWSVPAANQVTDSDFGTSPILFNDSSGNQLVGAINKNGYLYAFSRSNIAAGPVWQVQVAVGGTCPTCGQGSVSSMAFANGTLYAAAGNTTINGTSCSGSVRAINPANGAFIWQHCTSGVVVPALGYDNGLLADGEGATLEILDAGSGSVLNHFATRRSLYGAPVFANGMVYVGSVDNNEYAFGLPGSPPPPTCPSGWSCADIGNPTPAGSQSVSGSNWTIQGGGADIWGSYDRFHFISQTASGSGSISLDVTSQTRSDGWAKAGAMVRASTDPGAAFYDVFVSPDHGIAVQYRTTQGGNALEATLVSGNTPTWVGIGYSGTTFTAYTSSDGNAWTAVPASSETIAMGSSLLDGVAVTSHTSSALSTVNVMGVLVSSSTTPPARSSGGCPSGWTCGDVGAPNYKGAIATSGNTWTITDASNDIWGTSDRFYLVSKQLGGDGSISAHVTSETNTDPWTKGGVMLRGSSAAGAPNYTALVTPGHGVTVQWRSATGGSTFSVTIPGSAPIYLKVTRSGTTFTAYTSSNGTTWSAVPNSSQNLPNLAGPILEGVAVTSHVWNVACTIALDSVTAS